MAVSLDDYLWEKHSLVTERIQIICLTETHFELITPSLTITPVGNGCKGYGSHIFIPANSELTRNINTTV